MLDLAQPPALRALSSGSSLPSSAPLFAKSSSGTVASPPAGAPVYIVAPPGTVVGPGGVVSGAVGAPLVLVPSAAAAAIPASTPGPSSSAPAPAPAPAAAYHFGYLSSWPLVGKLASYGGGREFIIPRLDIDKEKALLFESLNEAKKAIKLRMEVATAMNLRTLTTLGRSQLQPPLLPPSLALFIILFIPSALSCSSSVGCC